VIAGAYAVRPCPQPAVTIAVVGALTTEGLEAAERLTHMGIAVEVICVTSPGLLFEAMQGRCGRSDSASWILDQVFPAERAAPMVTVLDGHPHTLAFLPSINEVPGRSLGVSEFGQSGSLEEVFSWHGIDTDSIVRAALDLTD
jgi:pyruvate dehydrogenase E1 component